MYYNDYYSDIKYVFRAGAKEKTPFFSYDFERFSSQYKESSSFTQSLMWTKVKDGWDYDTIVIEDKGKNTVCQCLVLIKKLPFLPFTFLYAPRGPLCDFSDKETLEQFLEEVKKLCKKHRAFYSKPTHTSMKRTMRLLKTSKSWDLFTTETNQRMKPYSVKAIIF